MKKALLRPAMIVLPMIAGLFFPAAGRFVSAPWHLVRYTLFVMIFLAALPIRVSELRPRREHWRLLAVNILMGVLPFALVRSLFPEQRELALALFFLGITPTAAASSVIISLLNCRVGFALTGFAVSNIGISLAMLGLLPLTTGRFTFDFVGDVACTLFLLIALPVTLAWLCRRFRPALAQAAPRMKMFSLSLWSCSLFILAAHARQYVIDHPGDSARQLLICAAVSLIVCVLNFSVGAWIAPRRLRRECSQLLGQKNTIFSICLALAYASPFVALALTFYIVWHNLCNAFQLLRYDRRRQSRLRRRSACQ